LTANRDLAIAALAGTAGLRCDVPEGGIFLFPDIGTWLGNAPQEARKSAAAWLRDRHRLAVVDGSRFGAPGHVRLSFAVPQDMLLAGVTKLRRALESTSK
jgi:aspartate aminotransferase